MKIEFTPVHSLQYAIREGRKCVHPVIVPGGNRGRNNKHGTKCNNLAKFVLDGKPYCLRHSQVVALQYLLSQGKKK